MDIELISDEFRLQQANRYSLWLHLSDNDCSFVILDDASKVFVGIKKVSHISLTKTIELFDELSVIPFTRVFLSLDVQPSLLVPKTLFRQENKRDLLTFSAEFNEEYEVVEHHLPSLSAVNLFAVAPSFKTFVAPYFPKANFVHTSSAVLTAIANLSRSSDTNQIIGINLIENGLYICMFDGGKLTFSNYYSVKTREDRLYWMLRLCDQFALHTHQVRLYVQGVENLMDERVAFLKPYFPKLSLIPFPEGHQLAPELASESIEMFTDLFYLPLCEL